MTEPTHSFAEVPEPPRLAYLLSQYPAINHAFMLREIRQLRAMGFSVYVCSVREADRPESALTTEEKEEQLTTFYIKTQRRSFVLRAHAATIAARPMAYLRGIMAALRMGRGRPVRTASALLYFMEAVMVGDWMRRTGVSHVHTHYASNVALILTRVFPVKMSATFHGPDEFKDPAGFQLAEKVALSEFVSVISDYARSQTMLSSNFAHWKKIEVCRLGVDIKAFTPVTFRTNPEPFQLLCAGRLAPVKGQHVLIEAMQLLAQQGCLVRVHIAGDGPDRRALEDHVAAAGLCDRVVFHGFLNQHKLRELFGSIDLFVLPSFAEGVPIVLMESMALGVPCIATHVNGIPELIRNGVEGITVAPGNPWQLADAIKRAMSTPDLRQQLRMSGRQRAAEIADLDHNVRRLAEVFIRYLPTGNSVTRCPGALIMEPNRSQVGMK